jgi:hypothetical protein
MTSGPRAAISWVPAAWGWPAPRIEQLRGTGVLAYWAGTNTGAAVPCSGLQYCRDTVLERARFGPVLLFFLFYVFENI